ncbi:MAG: hypothetical protein K2G48_02710 [Malacoplasma sp.]|nr:hypothetical protein [Malacoplasma sp.]
MKKLKKWWKGLALSSFVGITAISLVACGQTGATHAFTSTPTNLLQDNNSPLNETFNNSPTSTYAQTALYNLTTYQTTGQFVTSPDGGFSQTTDDTLILEGASAVIVFKDETVMKDVDDKIGNNLITENKISQSEILAKLKDIKTSVDKSTTVSPTEQNIQETKDDAAADDTTTDEPTSDNTKWEEGKDYWVFTRNKGGIQFQKGIDQDPDTNISQYYNDAVSNGKTYQFIIDTDNYWVDENGQQQQAVSSHDFERGLETYALSAAIGYTRNEYFLDLIGLGTESLGKTISYQNSDKQYVSPADVNYDINNFVNVNDAVYTMYIDEEYPYALDLISKEYFGALPNTNNKVKNISLKSGKIVLDDGVIDQSKTNWNEIFGSGGLNNFTKDTWYAGAYYISAFTGSQIIFNLNSIYMDTVGQDLLSYVDGKIQGTNNQNTDERIKQVVINYGSGTADTYFENYKAGQIDYLSSVPEAKRSEANSLSGVTPTKVIQTTQSNYIAYTPHPYTVNKDGKVSANENVPDNMADFIYQWDSKDAMTIRAGIAGLVNYNQLAYMVYSNSRDFQLSATPYGAFKNYYENVAKGDIYGALPRPYADYQASSADTVETEFEIPYYSWNSTDQKVNIEKIKINKDTFKTAINNFKGNSASLNFSIKFGEGSFSTNYEQYLIKFQETVKDLSGEGINVVINPRLGSNPTSTEWYNSQSSPLGFSYWAPDYNGVGTWIEADNTLQSTTVNNTTYEGVPSTNSHNAFHTYLTAMIYAVKLMNYTWNETDKKYAASTTTSGDSQTTTDPYINDDRIQKAFSESSLADFGIQTNDSAFDNKNTPGEKYGAIAIEFLNMLIEKQVFDQTKVQSYIDDPSKLQYSSTKPTKENPYTAQNLYVGGDVIKAGQSANFSKYLGIFAGESTAKALWENTVLDSDYSFIPKPEAGLKETIISLVKPGYVARSGTQSINYRDFGIKK